MISNQDDEQAEICSLMLLAARTRAGEGDAVLKSERRTEPWNVRRSGRKGKNLTATGGNGRKDWSSGDSPDGNTIGVRAVRAESLVGLIRCRRPTDDFLSLGRDPIGATDLSGFFVIFFFSA